MTQCDARDAPTHISRSARIPKNWCSGLLCAMARGSYCDRFDQKMNQSWQGLLACCSDESIRLRFRAILKRSAHEVATRYCFVDYDREMAIVAEVNHVECPQDHRHGESVRRT